MCNFARTEFVTNLDGKLWRMISATCMDGSQFLVARICEDGTQTSRNLDYCGMFGWRFSEPGRKYRTYTGTYTATIDEWGDYTPSLENLCWRNPSEHDCEVILSKYPEFHWVLDKVGWSITQIFKALKLWKKNARLMETLVSMGCNCLALNGSMYTARDPMAIVKWVSRHMDEKNRDLRDIRLMMAGYDPHDVEKYRYEISSWNYVTIDEWLYLESVGFSARFYRDYRHMAEKAGHDLKDSYWRFPKDLRKAHDKVMKECARIEKLKKQEAARKKQESYSEAVKRMLEKVLESEGMKVFVPATITEIERQAKALHQCLVTADYIGKVANRECVLVFVTKNGKPYATAELRIKGRKFALGQFYGDERKKDYKAKEDAREALNAWAETYKVRMVA